jgi:hypothetical protein
MCLPQTLSPVCVVRSNKGSPNTVEGSDLLEMQKETSTQHDKENGLRL